MSLVAYELKTALTAKRPMRWDIQVRYALRQPDQSLTLPAGTWLLSLPEPEETGQNGRSHNKERHHGRHIPAHGVNLMRVGANIFDVK